MMDGIDVIIKLLEKRTNEGIISKTIQDNHRIMIIGMPNSYSEVLSMYNEELHRASDIIFVIGNPQQHNSTQQVGAHALENFSRMVEDITKIVLAEDCPRTSGIKQGEYFRRLHDKTPSRAYMPINNQKRYRNKNNL